jgi:hypothetical protein
MYFKPCGNIFQAFQNAAGVMNLVLCIINLLCLRYTHKSYRDVQLNRVTVLEWKDSCEQTTVSGSDYILSLV